MSLNINKNFGAIAGGALTALNAHQSEMGKSITRVSTGMRVNGPADDVAAYMTSRRIKSDSDGYTALYNGLQTGSAKLNAADAAVSSVLDVLNSMKSKALQYQAAGDDAASQASIATEYNNLNRVLESSLNFQYNGEQILNSHQSLSFYTAMDDDVNDVALAYDSTIKIDSAEIKKGTDVIGAYSASAKLGTFTFGGINYSVNDGSVYETADTDTVIGKIKDSGIAWAGDYLQSKVGGTYIEIGASDYKLTGNYAGYNEGDVMGADSKVTVHGLKYTLNTGLGAASGGTVVLTGKTDVLGSWINDNGNLKININGGNPGSIGVGWSNIKDKVTTTSISNVADDSILDNLKKVISQVSGEHAKITSGIGALEQASSYLQNSAQAQDTAYTSITEADMAKEMTNYVKNNVYAQAAQAMIAQANQSMAQVLNLLQ